MLDQLLGSRCLQPNAVFVSAIYSTIYMKNGKVVYQITRESLNVVLLSPSSALFKSPPSPPMRFSPGKAILSCWDSRNPAHKAIIEPFFNEMEEAGAHSRQTRPS